MGDRGSFGRGARIYVGGLSHDTKKEDLENEFEKFGKLNHVWVAFNPPGFAFIEFSNKTDAENACDSMNGTELLGGKLRVEMSRERERGGSFRGSGYRGRGGPRGGSGGGGGFGGGYWGRGRGGFRESGGRGFGGRRGSFRGREYVRGGGGVSRDSYGGGGGGGGGGGSGGNYGSSYGGGGGNYSGGRSNYSRSRGSSRFRSRSPVGAGGSRRY